jgi:hypothetical protein
VTILWVDRDDADVSLAGVVVLGPQLDGCR